MSNTVTFEDFYQVPDLSFDIDKLRADLDIILKKSKYQTLGISNFAAIPMNKIPGDENSIKAEGELHTAIVDTKLMMNFVKKYSKQDPVIWKQMQQTAHKERVSDF